MTTSTEPQRPRRRIILLALAFAAILAAAIALYTTYGGLRPASGTAVAMGEAASLPSDAAQPPRPAAQ